MSIAARFTLLKRSVDRTERTPHACLLSLDATLLGTEWSETVRETLRATVEEFVVPDQLIKNDADLHIPVQVPRCFALPASFRSLLSFVGSSTRLVNGDNTVIELFTPAKEHLAEYVQDVVHGRVYRIQTWYAKSYDHWGWIGPRCDECGASFIHNGKSVPHHCSVCDDYDLCDHCFTNVSVFGTTVPRMCAAADASSKKYFHDEKGVFRLACNHWTCSEHGSSTGEIWQGALNDGLVCGACIEQGGPRTDGHQKEHLVHSYRHEQWGCKHLKFCDGCGDERDPFRDVYYHCTVCDDFDFCSKCYEKEAACKERRACKPEAGDRGAFLVTDHTPNPLNDGEQDTGGHTMDHRMEELPLTSSEATEVPNFEYYGSMFDWIPFARSDTGGENAGWFFINCNDASPFYGRISSCFWDDHGRCSYDECAPNVEQFLGLVHEFATRTTTTTTTKEESTEQSDGGDESDESNGGDDSNEKDSSESTGDDHFAVWLRTVKQPRLRCYFGHG